MNHCVKLICVASLSALLSSSCSTYKEGRGNFPAIPDELPSHLKWEYNLDKEKEKDKDIPAFEDLSLDVDTAEYRANSSSSLDVELLCANTEESSDEYSSTCVEKCSLDSSHSSTYIEEYFNLPNPTVDTREYKTVCEGDNPSLWGGNHTSDEGDNPLYNSGNQSSQTDNKIITPIQQFSITDEEREMLKYIVEQETRGGSYRHKCIITNVILNRVKDSRFPNTVREVLLQRNQFSSLWNYYQKRNEPDEKTEKAVNDVLNGRVEDESKGSLYFHSMKSDGWFSSLSFVMEVEGHRFFK